MLKVTNAKYYYNGYCTYYFFIPAILGQTSPGIEPFASNYYKQVWQRKFHEKEQIFSKTFRRKRLDNEDVWREIMLNHGSVQHMTQLSQTEKRCLQDV